MKRILAIGITVATLHFLFCNLAAYISPDSRIALFYLGIFATNTGALFNDLFNPVFAVAAHLNPAPLFSWKPVHYTLCLLLSSAVYGLIAMIAGMLLSRGKPRVTP